MAPPRRSARNRQSEDEEGPTMASVEPRQSRGRRSSVATESQTEEESNVPEPPIKKRRNNRKTAAELNESATESDVIPTGTENETEAETEAEALETNALSLETTVPSPEAVLPVETALSTDKDAPRPPSPPTANARKYTVQSATESSLPPNQTLFVTNLPTARRFPTAREDVRRALYHFFGPYGAILDVVAGRRPGLRGTAFIVFKDIRAAVEAMRQLQGFPFYERPLRIQFARTKSKATRDMDLILRASGGGQ